MRQPMRLLLWCLAAGFGLGLPVWAVPILTMTRTIVPEGVYEPGVPLDVTITLDFIGDDTLTALGVEEVFPPGWTFDSVVSEDGPSIVPPADWPELLEFAWFPLPEFPVSFTYRVNPPQGEGGSPQIVGEAYCRVSGVGPVSSGSVITGLSLPGSLQVFIEPAGARLAGARWAVEGGAWQESGAVRDDVPAGQRVISFSQISGWQMPEDILAAIVADQLVTYTAEYTEIGGEGEGEGSVDLPHAAFTADPASGVAPLAVEFTDESTPGASPITSWVWDFGDGASSMTQHPSHVYDRPDTYRVTLLVTTALGADSEIKPGCITVSQGGPAEGENEGELPHAAFSADPVSGTAPLGVEFTDESTPGASPITSWAWDFGDAESSMAQHPSHVYGSPGTYRVTLLVTTAIGTDSEIKMGYITVGQGGEGEAEGESGGALPKAAFSANPTYGVAPLGVEFTDESTPGASPITRWSWDFGDDASSKAQHPSHVYNHPGTYRVTLLVATAIGADSEIKTGYIIVTEGGEGEGESPGTSKFLGCGTGDSPVEGSLIDLALPAGVLLLLVAGTRPHSLNTW